MATIKFDKNYKEMKRILVLLSLFVIAIACQNAGTNSNAENAKPGTEELKGEVMAVHDSAMAKMGTMARVQRQLKEHWENSQDSLRYKEAYNNLADASEGMMDWMRNFELPEEATDEEMRNFLLEEQKAIEEVHAAINEALSEGRQLLEETENNATGEEDTSAEDQP